MKPLRRFAVWLILPLVAAGCATTSDAPVELPPVRPADFAVNLCEVGGPDDPHHGYSISQQSLVYADSSENPVRSWSAAPDPAALDEFYSALRELQPHTLKAEAEAGKNKDRFGYQLTLTYDGHKHTVADQGDQYIQLEVDYNRFMDIVSTVHEFVGQGIAAQMIPLQVYLSLDPKMPLPTALSVDLEERNLIELGEQVAPGDTLEGYAKPLSGTYRLHATATVDGKELKYESEVALVEAPRTVYLQLAAEGFQERK